VVLCSVVRSTTQRIDLLCVIMRERRQLNRKYGICGNVENVIEVHRCWAHIITNVSCFSTIGYSRVI